MGSDAAYFPDALSNAEVRAPDSVRIESCAEPADGNDTKRRVDTVATAADPSDECLLQELAKGDKDALGLLFRRHGRIVRNVAWRILRHEAEAEDLVQDVFIFLFRKASLFKASHGTARSWIVQATYHRAFNRRSYLNSRHFYTNKDVDQVLLTVAQQQAEKHFVEWSLEGVWGKESAVRLRKLLSPSQLMTIELHFFEGYTLEEIAQQLGQTLINVRHHYYRALEKLRKPAFAGKLRSK